MNATVVSEEKSFPSFGIIPIICPIFVDKERATLLYIYKLFKQETRMKRHIVNTFAILLATSFLLGACGKSKGKEANAVEADSIQVNETVHLFGDSTKPACNLIVNFAYASETADVRLKDSLNSYFLAFCFGDKYGTEPVEEGVQKYAADTGNNAFQKGPAAYDSAQQVQIIEELIAQDIDAICVVPIDPAACETVLKKAMDQGIVVITHESPSQENCNYNIEAFDNVGYGAYMMDELAKAMGEEGEYVCMVGFLTTASHMEWSQAAIDRQRDTCSGRLVLVRKSDSS